MMRYLVLEEVLALHAEAIRIHGGSEGVRDLGLIQSATAQPQMTFAGEDLYPTLVEKAAAIGFSLITNHGFIDGNKRVGLAALDVMLRLNGYMIPSQTARLEETILAVASGIMNRDEFTEWVRNHVVSI